MEGLGSDPDFAASPNPDFFTSPVPKCEEPGAPSRHTPELDFRIRRSGHVLSHPSLETSEGRGTHFVGGQETPSTGFVATQNPGFGK